MLGVAGSNYRKDVVKAAEDNRVKAAVAEEMRESLGVFKRVSTKKRDQELCVLDDQMQKMGAGVS